MPEYYHVPHHYAGCVMTTLGCQITVNSRCRLYMGRAVGTLSIINMRYKCTKLGNSREQRYVKLIRLYGNISIDLSHLPFSRFFRFFLVPRSGLWSLGAHQSDRHFVKWIEKQFFLSLSLSIFLCIFKMLLRLKASGTYDQCILAV